MKNFSRGKCKYVQAIRGFSARVHIDIYSFCDIMLRRAMSRPSDNYPTLGGLMINALLLCLASSGNAAQKVIKKYFNGKSGNKGAFIFSAGSVLTACLFFIVSVVLMNL